MLRRCVPLLALALLLSGCSGPADREGASPDVALADAAATPADQGLTRARFDGDFLPTDLAFEDTFAAGESAECFGYINAGVAGRVDLCTGEPHRYDLSSSLVAGHAYTIYANATVKDDAGDGITLALSEDEVWSKVDVDESDGEVRLVGRLIRLGDAPVGLVVEHFLSFADVPYFVSVEIRLLGLFVPQVPVALDVRPDASRMVLPARPDGVVRIWDGDDRYVGHFPLDGGLGMDLEGVQTRQGLILQFFNVSDDLPIQVSQDTPASLRYLGTQAGHVLAGAVTGLPGHDWELEVDTVPVGLGLYFGAEGRWNTWETEFYLESPGGPSVSIHSGCLCEGYRYAPLGSDGQEPLLGSYHVGARPASLVEGLPWPALAQGVEVGLYLVHYLR